MEGSLVGGGLSPPRIAIAESCCSRVNGTPIDATSLRTAPTGAILLGPSFTGTVDEVKIFDVALTPAQIAAEAGVSSTATAPHRHVIGLR